LWFLQVWKVALSAKMQHTQFKKASEFSECPARKVRLLLDYFSLFFFNSPAKAGN
jgi:hypothetical protein